MRYLLVFLLLLLAATISHADEDWPVEVISGVENNEFMIPPVDFDGDGDLDLLTGGGTSESITLFTNDGTGNFTSTVLLTGLGTLRRIAPADFDSDGAIDLAVTTNDFPGYALYVYFNDGNNQFTPVLLETFSNLHAFLTVGDIDQDGSPDILTPYAGGAKWFQNDGMGEFDDHLLDFGATFCLEGKITDLDLDGDNDLILEMNLGSTGVYFAENQGGNTFTLGERFHDSNPEIVQLADINNDGRDEIVIEDSDDVYLYAYINSAFVSRTLAQNVYVRALTMTDLDLDGDTDLIYASTSMKRLGWAQYQGGDQFSDQRLAGEWQSIWWSFHHGDFDGDGDDDVVAIVNDYSGNFSVFMWRNPDYQVGFNLTKTVDRDGLVSLSWTDLNADAYQIKRDNVVLATVNGTTYADQLTDHITHDYTVTANPQDPDSKPSYPATAFWPDVDQIALIEDFDQGRPSTWRVQNTTATFTWTSGRIPSRFSTKCMLIGRVSDYFGLPTDEWRGRLVTPTIPKTSAAHVELAFDQHLLLADALQCEVQYSTDGGETWHVIQSYERGQDNLQHFDLTSELTGHRLFQIGFAFDAHNEGDRWAIDDVMIVVDEQPVTLTLSPQTTTVPEQGGDLFYDASLVSSVASPFANLSFWLEVKLPNGQEYVQIEVEQFNLPAWGDLHWYNRVLSVPANAPAGDYLVNGYVGRPLSGFPILQEQFVFVKEGDPNAFNGDFDLADWAAANGAVSTANLNSNTDNLPNAYALHAAYPNPFNPTTTISVALPEAADLSVTVVNTLGQQVAELTNGRTAAGTHAFTFDASALSSGIYFVHATVPGQLNAVQKVVLMK
ncbi:VCBS repeat-containing protein [bacterium]|nr:VCBS repeat-containing protein [bacterium]